MTAPAPDAAIRSEDLLGAFDAVPDAVLLLDQAWRVVHVNAAGVEQVRTPAAELLGRVVWDVFPQTRDHPTYAAAHEVVRTGRPAQIVWRIPGGRTWYEQRISRSGGLVVIASREVTAAQDEAERRRRLSRISEALAAAETPDEVSRVITDLALPLAGASSGGVIVRDDEPGVIRSMRWVGLDERTRTDFARYPLATRAPGAEAIRTRAFVWASDADIRERWPDIADPLLRTGARSAAGVPMTVLGESLGALVLQFAVDTPPDAATEDFLRTVAAVCGMALHRTRRLAAEHEVALFLQRSLLPHVPERIAQLTLHARYRPGGPGIEVGGDWYDVVPLDSDQVVLIVADVQGHDLAAATIMGQLRSVARALALEGLPPGALLVRLDHFLEQVTTERIVTALVLLVDTASRFVVAASAGHPAPLVRSPGLPVAALHIEPGPPLGTGLGQVWPETTAALPGGAALLAFTDGLIETRHEPIDDSVAGLAALLDEAPAGAGPEALVELALAFLPPEQRGDDVALLGVRLEGAREVAPQRTRRRFPPQEFAVPLARRWLQAVLSAWDVGGEAAELAPLVLTELVSNAVRHTREAVEVTIALRDDDPAEPLLDIAVRDDSHRLPIFAGWPADDSASGRGLQLVQQVVARVEVRQHTDGGKTVHAYLSR